MHYIFVNQESEACWFFFMSSSWISISTKFLIYKHHKILHHLDSTKPASRMLQISWEKWVFHPHFNWTNIHQKEFGKHQGILKLSGFSGGFPIKPWVRTKNPFVSPPNFFSKKLRFARFVSILRTKIIIVAFLARSKSTSNRLTSWGW